MLDIYPGPTEPTSASGYTVMAVATALLFIVLGLVGLAVRFFAENPDPETASKLTAYSLVSIGFGALVSFGTWLVRRFAG